MELIKQHLDNYWNGNDPKSIVFHSTWGTTADGAIQTLIARGLSYNYLIDGGDVYELVPPDKSAWHAGVLHNPTQKVKKFYKGKSQ